MPKPFVPATGPFKPTWKSLARYTVPDWYLDGKFGIFVHWGPYAVPAYGNEWYPRNMYQRGTPEFEHNVATYGPQDRFGYKDFIPLFRAEHFDPDAWAGPSPHHATPRGIPRRLAGAHLRGGGQVRAAARVVRLVDRDARL